MPSPSLNISRCRTCFKETKQLADILKSHVIRNLIQTYLHISVKEADPSHYVCESCVENLYQFQTFYQSCHNAQRQICEYEDLMSQFRHVETPNLVDQSANSRISISTTHSRISTPSLCGDLHDYRQRANETYPGNQMPIVDRQRSSILNESYQDNHRTLNDVPMTNGTYPERVLSERPRTSESYQENQIPVSRSKTPSKSKKQGRGKSMGPYEKTGSNGVRSKSVSDPKKQTKTKRIIAFKLKYERPHNILKLILMDRSTKDELCFDELSFDELNDVKRCVNDPKVFSKIEENIQNAARISDETRNILRSLVKHDIF